MQPRARAWVATGYYQFHKAQATACNYINPPLADRMV